MSWISHAIVVHGYENSRERLAEVNAKLFELDTARRQSFGVPDKYEDLSWTGGTKYFVEDIWLAAFNYVSLEKVLTALQSANWEKPEEVILIWQDENDYKWNVGPITDFE